MKRVYSTLLLLLHYTTVTSKLTCIILENISQTLREELPNLGEKYQVESLAIFGSYTKNTQSKNSDLDLLVTFSAPPSLFEFIRLENHLSELLGINVDLVMKDALKKNIGERIQKELVQVQ